MEVSVKTREDRVRRTLAKHGLILKKTPSRSWLRQYYGPGYMIVDPFKNWVVAGASNREYDCDLGYVEWHAFEKLVKQ